MTNINNLRLAPKSTNSPAEMLKLLKSWISPGIAPKPASSTEIWEFWLAYAGLAQNPCAGTFTRIRLGDCTWVLASPANHGQPSQIGSKPRASSQIGQAGQIGQSSRTHVELGLGSRCSPTRLALRSSSSACSAEEGNRQQDDWVSNPAGT